MNKKIIAAIVLIIVVVAGYFLIRQAFYPYPPERPAPQASIPTQSENQTVGWKTYTDSKYGFSFQYPQDWQVNNQSFTSSNKPSINILISSPVHSNPALSQDVVYLLEMGITSSGKKVISWSGFFKSPFLRSEGGPVLLNIDQSVVESTTEYQQAQEIFNSFVIETSSVNQLPFSTNKPGWKTYSGIGFEVQYPENNFALVQVTKQLPPDYKANYNGAKLISSARVNRLGKQECSYGESGLTSVCKAEMEGGIEFVQVNASAQSLTFSLDNSLKTTVTLAGKQSVKWSIGAEGEGTDYYYIPLNSNQTLVVARLYGLDSFPQQTLFNQVLATLVIK